MRQEVSQFGHDKAEQPQSSEGHDEAMADNIKGERGGVGSEFVSFCSASEEERSIEASSSLALAAGSVQQWARSGSNWREVSRAAAWADGQGPEAKAQAGSEAGRLRLAFMDGGGHSWFDVCGSL